ncbi:ABC transporter substrate-binding protein [Streptomycetaceae bacterium NBC_01309]
MSAPRDVLPRRVAAAAAVVLFAAGAVGCTVEDAKDAGASTAGGLGAPAAAVSPGVTADSIKVGIAYPDLDAVKAFVNVDNGDYEATFRALIDKVNAAGGIHGRKIVPVFGKVNPISPSAAQETCLKLTQDEKVFAVLGAFNGPDQALCYVETNKTAVIGGLQSKDGYAKAQVPWFAASSGPDQSKDVIQALAGHGDFTGRKVAVLSATQNQAETEHVVLPALQRNGVTPVATGYLPSIGVDSAALAQQSAVMLEKARTAGADTLVLSGIAAQMVPQALEKSSWRPKLLFAEPPYAYLLDKGKHDFSVLNGATAAYPVVSWDTDADMMTCIATLEAADPRLKGKLVDPDTVAGGQPNPSNSLRAACGTVKLFTAIADKAGRDLNYRTFQDAGFSLGSFHMPSFADQATYSAQSTNGSIPVKIHVYDPATNGFVPKLG